MKAKRHINPTLKDVGIVVAKKNRKVPINLIPNPRNGEEALTLLLSGIKMVDSLPLTQTKF